MDSDVFSSVRYNQHGDDLGYGYPHTLRVVLDLKGGASYAKNITVEAGSSGVRITATPSASPSYPPLTPTSTPSYWMPATTGKRWARYIRMPTGWTSMRRISPCPWSTSCGTSF